MRDHTRKKTSGKTPYEIRLELLQLATEIATNQHQAKSVEEQMKKGTGEIYPSYSAPDVAEVIKLAEQLNEFVSNANKNER